MESKFYKIGEISKMLQVPASTLRYWETEFNQLKPTKSSGGQRFYTQKHIDLLKNLKQMLYAEKYTIDGAKKKLKTPTSTTNNGDTAENLQAAHQYLPSISQNELKKELTEILSLLK